MGSSSGRRIAIAGVSIVVLALAVRAMLPLVLTQFVNRSLGENEGYRGSVEDVDLSILRGAYAIHGLTLEKIEGTEQVAFLYVETMDLSVQWWSLLEGSLVAEVELLRPEVHLVHGPLAADRQAGDGVDWRLEIKKLVPIRINRVAVFDGTVHFDDFSTTPPVSLTVVDVQVEATNLMNSQGLPGALVAGVDVSGQPLGYGRIMAHVDADPFAAEPTFSLNAGLQGVSLPSLATLISSTSSFKVLEGKLDVYCELTSRDGRFTGFLKPVLTDVKLLEGQTTVVIKDRVTAQTPIAGDFVDPLVGSWPAVWKALGNAFVAGLDDGLRAKTPLRGADPLARLPKAVHAAPATSPTSERRPLFGKRRKAAR